jgi:Tol biopolymer transport system component/DNA-binding winged helix-turn-helix (wHTH) protein
MAVAVERGSVQFGPFRVDLKTQRLYREQLWIKLPRQSFLILKILLERPGEVVTREELRSALWPSDTFVDFDHGLNNAVNRIRVALNDGAEAPTYIETLPRIGYRFVGEVRAQEEKTPEPPRGGEEIERSHDSAGILPRFSKRHRVWVVSAAAVIISFGLIAVVMVPEVERLVRLRNLQTLTAVPLTALPGIVGSPTFSPDGTQIAFLWYDPTYSKGFGGFGLFAKQIGQDKPRQLTRGTPSSWTLWAAWSPDGKYIAVCRAAGLEAAAGPTGSAIYLVSPLGESERKINTEDCSTDFFKGGLSWSPDGKQLAFLIHPSDEESGVARLRLLSFDSMEEAPIETMCKGVLAPAFSPNGEYLAWACADDLSDVSIYIKHVNSKTITRLLRGIDGIGGLAWSADSRRILYSTGFSGGDLWEASLDRPNRPEKLPFGHDVTDLTVNGRAKRLVFKQNHTNTNIWRVDLLNPKLQAEKVVASSRVQVSPNYSPDGTKIAFESNRSGSNEIWVCDADGSNAVQLTSFGILVTGTPRWSPDGRQIVFDSRAGHEANLYTIDPRGSTPRKLSIDIRGNSMPSWSHDGKWIYFVNGDDIGSPKIWKVPSEGGHAVQLASHPGRWPLESSDGRFIYFSSRGRLWQVALDGSGEHQVEGSPIIGPDEWTLFGTGVYLLSYGYDRTEINFFDLVSKQTRSVHLLNGLPPSWMGGMSVSSDGRWLLFPQLDSVSSEFMMVENWQ